MVTFPINVAFGLFLLSLLFFGAARIGASDRADRIGTGSLLAGWLALTMGLALRWALSGRAPMSNQYESLLVLGWFLALGGLWTGWRYRFEGSGLLTGVLAAAALAAASLFDPSLRPLMPALRSNWLIYHVVTAMAAYAAFALAAAGSAMILTFFKRRPGADKLEEMVYQTARIGFFLLSVGIATGAVWADRAWGSYWSWDPKETWSLITWIYYAAALHLRRSLGWSGRRFAWLCLGGLAMVLITYFGVNFLLGGLHSYS